MKTKTVLLSIIGLSTISFFSFTKNTNTIGVYNHLDARYPGGAPFGVSGEPGGTNCTMCHSGSSAISNSSVASISFSGTNNKYIPGSTYTINVELVGAPSPKNGFEIVALRNSDNANVGNISITDATNTQIVTGLSKTYVTQTSAGNSITSWSFDWTAPTNGEGDITFYSSSIVSNNDGSSSGDETHLKQLVIQEDASNDVLEQSEIVSIDNSLKLINDNNWIKTSLFVEKAKYITSKVMTLNGKIIYSNKSILTVGKNNLEPINLSNYSKGIYIINYTIDNQIISRKVFI